MKPHRRERRSGIEPSLPSRGAWIETVVRRAACNQYRSLPSRGAWIETGVVVFCKCLFLKSLPSRGAWIETRLMDVDQS